MQNAFVFKDDSWGFRNKFKTFQVDTSDVVLIIICLGDKVLCYLHHMVIFKVTSR